MSQSSSRSKITLVLSVVIALVLGIVIGSFIPKIEASIQAKKEAQLLAQKQAAVEEQLKQDRVLTKDEFSVKMPAGWAEVPAMPSTSATVMFVKEVVKNEALQKINFKSYYAVTYDTLNKRGLAGYVTYLKGTLQKLLLGIKFVSDKTEKIGGLEARVMEAEVTQKGADFKVLIVVIKGANDDVWTVSFNTGKDTWDSYKDSFYSIARGFQLKTTAKTPDVKK